MCDDVRGVVVCRMLEAWAEGKWDARAPDDGPYGMLLNGVGELLEERAETSLVRAVDVTSQLANLAEETARLTRDMNAIGTETVQTAGAAEEMTVTSASILETARLTASRAEALGQSVSEGASHLRASVDQVDQIAASTARVNALVQSLATLATEVSSVSASIQQIASRTNLLALNATIEAARAGEAGRGFAVVAEEVKNLSRQTGKATGTIGGIVESIQQEIGALAEVMEENKSLVDRGRASVIEVAREFEVIEGEVGGTVDRMDEIADLLGEQQNACRLVSESVNHISSASSLDRLQRFGDLLDAMNDTAGENLDAIADEVIPKKIIRLAKTDHMIWKKRLWMAAVGRLQLDPSELSDHRSCRLGHWYDTEQGPLAQHPAFRALAEPHERVHRHGIEAAACFARGDHDAAMEELARLEEASRDVMRLLDELEAAR